MNYMPLLQELHLPTRPTYRKEIGIMAVLSPSILTLWWGDLGSEQILSSRQAQHILFSGFKMSRAGSREEDFQRMSWWGKVWVINHWRCLKVLRHLGAAPHTAGQAKPSRSIDREKGVATSLRSLRNVQWSREGGSGHSSCWGYLPLSPLGTDVDLEARRGRRGPNPLSWDPSPGSKAFMIGRGNDKVSALTHERQQEAGHIDTLESTQ